jgi:hypothetical protein
LALTHCPFYFLGKEGPVPAAQEVGLTQSQSRHGGEENESLIMNV